MDLKRKKILLSNSPELLYTIRESILQTSQVTPLIASNAQEVLALTRFWQPDLIILGPEDVSSICQALKTSADFRDIAFIALVQDNAAHLRDAVLAAGCDDWLATPIDEMNLLTKIQDLTGIRFRKLPRYSYQAPAMVAFKGREFASRSIDINRRMIFLESKEGLAPATGRNVHVTFQISKDETVLVWGRVVKLMARKLPNEAKETIGMLIRFLDLPEAMERRIDLLAMKQAGNVRLIDNTADKKTKTFEWFNFSFYEELLQESISQSASPRLEKLALPRNAFEAFLGCLTQEESSSFKSDSDPLLRQTIAARLKVADDLAKLRLGSPQGNADQTLQSLESLESDIEKHLQPLLTSSDGEKLVFWARIKYEVLRSHLELKAMVRGKNNFITPTVFSEEEKIRTPAPRWKAIALTVVIILLLALNFLFFQMSSGKLSPDEKMDLSSLGSEARALSSAKIIHPNLGGWTVFQGSLNDKWAKMSPDEQKSYCIALNERLKTKGVRQVLLYGPIGELRAGFINNRPTLFDLSLSSSHP